MRRRLKAAQIVGMLWAFALVGCAGQKIESFQAGRPLLDPGNYFAGRTHSWGVVETPGGKPVELITTQTQGHWEKDGFHFEQDISFGSGKRQYRSWLLQRVDAHHYTATGTGIVGIAHAKLYGNAMHLEFTLRLAEKNPLLDVRMSQWLYLQADGRTMINSDTLTKAGVVVGRITEQFEKEK